MGGVERERERIGGRNVNGESNQFELEKKSDRAKVREERRKSNYIGGK